MSAVERARPTRAQRAGRIAAALALAALAFSALSGCSAPVAPADPPPSPGASGAAPADGLGAAFDGAIEITTAEGARPELSWDEVAGAALYRVTVVQADGPTWAWSGTDAAVVLGGGVAGREGPGFALTSAATVYLAAFDADGAVLDTGIAELPGP